VKPAAALIQPREGIKGEPSREYHGEGQGRREDPEDAALRNPPPYGAWNVWKVMTGTGEALLGPGIAFQEQSVRITVKREIVSSREGGGGGCMSD
jgi:hypothetical protein